MVFIWFLYGIYLQPTRKQLKMIMLRFQHYSLYHPKYVRNDKYYTDGSHLNSIGADEFTKDLLIELRNRKILK